MRNLVTIGAVAVVAAVATFVGFKLGKKDWRDRGIGYYTPRDLDRQTRAAATVGRYGGGGLLSLRNSTLPAEGPYPGGGLLGLRG